MQCFMAWEILSTRENTHFFLAWILSQTCPGSNRAKLIEFAIFIISILRHCSWDKICRSFGVFPLFSWKKKYIYIYYIYGPQMFFSRAHAIEHCPIACPRKNWYCVPKLNFVTFCSYLVYTLTVQLGCLFLKWLIY